MKNLHLLPTDKPSRLHLYTDENGRRLETCEVEYSHTRNTQHIYITSDEEIKQGDWLFANQGVNKIVEIKEGNYPYGSINNKGDKIFNSKHWKSKIILTTDQDLIADGVQAIDDEFLEWFVKNPSCEFVEWSSEKIEGSFDGENWKYKYGTVIPQEEPKQETLTYTEAAKKEERIFNSTMMSKQETLEEAAANLADPNLCKTDNWIAGAKWQAERMYSEEEVMDMFDKFSMYLPLHYEFLVREMFKKKELTFKSE
jgi:hypothetical protein